MTVALISGGGTGIGRATARELARGGASVAICGRRSEPLEAVRAELEAAGTECLAVPADIREPEQVDLVVNQTLDRFGRVDILVNNAGGQFLAPAEEISSNGWRAVHRLAVDASWNMTRAVATRSMIPNRGGVVIFIGFSPRRGIPEMAHASAARAALENLAGALSNEWSRYGIRTLCVAPGTILTEGLEGYGPEHPGWPAGHPRGRGRGDRLPRLTRGFVCDRDDRGRGRRRGRLGARRAAAAGLLAAAFPARERLGGVASFIGLRQHPVRDPLKRDTRLARALRE